MKKYRTNINKTFPELLNDLNSTGVCQTISPKMQGKLRQYFNDRHEPINEIIIGYSINSQFGCLRSFYKRWNRSNYTLFAHLIYRKQVLYSDFMEAVDYCVEMYSRTNHYPNDVIQQIFEPGTSQQTIRRLLMILEPGYMIDRHAHLFAQVMVRKPLIEFTKSKSKSKT